MSRRRDQERLSKVFSSHTIYGYSVALRGFRARGHAAGYVLADFDFVSIGYKDGADTYNLFTYRTLNRLLHTILFNGHKLGSAWENKELLFYNPPNSTLKRGFVDSFFKLSKKFYCLFFFSG